jgi:hypothetical protein
MLVETSGLEPLTPALQKSKRFVGRRRSVPLTCGTCRPASLSPGPCRPAWLYGWLYSQEGDTLQPRSYLVRPAYPGPGIAPSCCMRPNASITTHCSAILLPVRRKMSTAWIVISRPVAGMPMNSSR